MPRQPETISYELSQLINDLRHEVQIRNLQYLAYSRVPEKRYAMVGPLPVDMYMRLNDRD